MPSMSAAYMKSYRKKRPDKTKALGRKHASKKYAWISISRIFLRILMPDIETNSCLNKN
jgi:hypothetical protein